MIRDVGISHHCYDSRNIRVTELLQKVKDLFHKYMKVQRPLSIKIVLETKAPIRVKPEPDPVHRRNQMNENLNIF